MAIERLALPVEADLRVAFITAVTSELRRRPDEIGPGTVFRTAKALQREFFACRRGFLPARRNMADRRVLLGMRANPGKPGAPRIALPRPGRFRGLSATAPRPSRQRSAQDAAALFPGYCFVLVALQWHRAAKAPGVICLVSSGEAPAKVPDKMIDDLKKREGRDGLIVLPSAPGFQRGDVVRITGGILAGQVALYEGMRGSERIAVLFRWLGSERTVLVPKADVVPVP